MHTSILKNFLTHSFVLFLSISARTQHVQSSNNRATISLTQQLSAFADISQLPQYCANTNVAQTSTYDITGGNNDGFNGTYSFIRKDADSNLVIFDVKGPGVINRIWTPTPTNDTLDFFIDDTVRPAFSIKYMDLFSNTIYPFVNPLCGNELGGYYCYLPVPFQTQCKIVCRAKQTQFHQVQYRLYPAGTVVKKFSTSLDAGEKDALKKVGSLWNQPLPGRVAFYGTGKNIITAARAINILPGQTSTLFNSSRGGRILEIKLDNAAAFEGLSKQVDIKITWDDENTPAVYCPIADFFGYAFGKISMQSLLLGTAGNENYCFLPMPFDRSAKIELIYRKISGNNNRPLQINAAVSYTNQTRDIKTEGKFYTCWNSNQLSAGDPAHVFLHTKGKGHYIGSMLLAQGVRAGMTYFFEGDDSTVADDVFRIHGTGSEDYFNGGWYAFPDRWSRKLSLPVHGCLDYSLPFCRTGAYRFTLMIKFHLKKIFTKASNTALKTTIYLLFILHLLSTTAIPRPPGFLHRPMN